MTPFRTCLPALVLASVICGSPAAARNAPAEPSTAERPVRMSWKVTNRSHADAQLRFFSKDRQIIWPAPQKAYILRDGQTDVFDFECRRGERVCYGAWVKSNQSIFWGVGTRASNDCADCCTACGETPRSRYLDTTGAEPMSQ